MFKSTSYLKFDIGLCEVIEYEKMLELLKSGLDFWNFKGLGKTIAIISKHFFKPEDFHFSLFIKKVLFVAL